MNALTKVLQELNDLVIYPMILVIFACGFFLFVWGLVQFLWNLNEGGDNKEGKQHMLWGIVGMLIMISVNGILGLLVNTFNLAPANTDVSRAQNIVQPFDR